ncbi:MAG: hypothetical protein COV76_04210 [Candidatus Omnitrophica bacterium CG11_big_fil_rev_8_21_14_0_20_64_10]|nr:MAG: hypothetical protein COV76_04210 [Candidatus Omnitrophica bacterium CG11_big_fil_rev_8_21_14_0_20_64_10]
MGSGALLFSVSLGRYARTLLRSGVPELLRRNDPRRPFAIFSPGAHDAAFREEFSHLSPVSFHELEKEAFGQVPWERALWKLCVSAQRQPALFRGAMGLHHTVYQRIRPVHYRKAFEALRPALLVTASAGFSTTLDVPLIREARTAGVPVLYVVHSWDNLNGLKGLMLERPDRLAVWNDRMKQQAVERYHYRPDQVEVVGALQMDLYQAPETFLSREAFFRQLGLDPARPMILLATGMPELDCGYLVEAVLRVLKENRFDGPPQLVCRAHPLEPHGYEAFDSVPGLVMDRFAHISNGLGWNPPLAESRHVANLVRHAAVVINVASTITLEAMLADTPTINVAYDPIHPADFTRHIHQDHWGRHFIPVEASGATCIVRDEAELAAGIGEALRAPAERRSARRQLAGTLVGPLDGAAHRRVAALIEGMLR